jgi:hypothetical protein
VPADARKSRLLGIGPVSLRILGAAGITSREQLDAIGPLQAFIAAKAVEPKVTLNLLWGLAGAATDTHWTKLPRDYKSRLLLDYDAWCDQRRQLAKLSPMNAKAFAMKFAKVYPLYVKKAERKNRTKQEVDQVIRWLTGYTDAGLRKQIEKEADFETFFAQAPRLNPNIALIKGVVCGVRVEDVKDPLMRKIRYLDKLVDELAKGKAMDKILRQAAG